ncbi:MAG: L-2-hydroxyglutarate oxidase [Chloroflexi bacterium]|nr:L-2-hydroxyglutarate oxidase [Chloroflexota bacterium]MDA1147988.1 L-2-hydroxyglutarate oxidase [Chloroflexota bacterium]
MNGSYDVAIIGGGILGLSSAMHLLEAHPGLRLTVIEKGAEVAGQQTGHNSGVIHSGIYYRPGSLKAQFCVDGRTSMVAFCERHGIAYDRCGKLIIAGREAELPRMDTLYERGVANGVEGLEVVGPERIAEIEPHVTAIKGLWSPATAIVDFSAVSRQYATEVRAAGGEIELGTRVTDLTPQTDGVVIETDRGEWQAKHLINCAGLHADRIASLMGVDHDLQIVPFRGEYYTLRKEREELVRGLIYPVPDPDLPFLGVHFTRNVKGYVEAGPNAVLATAREGYRKRDFNLGDFAETLRFPGFWRVARREWRTGIDEVNRSLRKSVFTKDLQKMIPEIVANDLVTGGAGVRAQAVRRDGTLLDDFAIERTAQAVHVLNAPSPGATSSLEIGRHIAGLAAEAFALS